jgi:hypothetical protein
LALKGAFESANPKGGTGSVLPLSRPIFPLPNKKRKESDGNGGRPSLSKRENNGESLALSPRIDQLTSNKTSSQSRMSNAAIMKTGVFHSFSAVTALGLRRQRRCRSSKRRAGTFQTAQTKPFRAIISIIQVLDQPQRQLAEVMLVKRAVCLSGLLK